MSLILSFSANIKWNNVKISDPIPTLLFNYFLDNFWKRNLTAKIKICSKKKEKRTDPLTWWILTCPPDKLSIGTISSHHLVFHFHLPLSKICQLLFMSLWEFFPFQRNQRFSKFNSHPHIWNLNRKIEIKINSIY